ncbi:GMC family oxidoreductase N-terminal domain-containing protein [Actinomycetospora atypica]|uniref:Cholesterol oxidase n=1 Tax=Actinomycetospora atypica TaxID=1290095 RepID=A0ABV9YIA5_9PSEU
MRCWTGTTSNCHWGWGRSVDEVERRQVVVVGSGFGGAVAACRLAQAGCDVLVLERGREYQGNFPRDARDDWLWKGQHGPFDVRLLRGVNVVTAAGVGGGSLLYSNVHLRLPADGFGDRWPSGWSREELDPYYDVVSAMLHLRRACEDEAQEHWPLPPKAGLLRGAADLLGACKDVFHPPLAVDFGDPRYRWINEFGAEQSGCRHCGKCSVGCNFGAKNSLDKNYLPLAVRHGAVVRARCEVTALSREPGSGYRIVYRDHKLNTDTVVLATTLVLAAGALGTTGLLLKHGEQLGDLSPMLGEHYSANGDYVTASLGVEKEWEPTRGPAITTSVLSDDGGTWFLVQDGGFPAFSVLDPETGVRPDRHDRALPVDDLTIQPGHVAILLAMGRDSATGRVRARRWCGDPLTVDWPTRENAAFYDAERDYLSDIGFALGEAGDVDPGRLTRVPVSVHSLGGAVMADSPDMGVVDRHGEVFGAPGLYVLDGAAIPAATGVNPSHTIAAVAERNAERLARLLIDDPGWTTPGLGTVPVYPDPLPVS